MDLKIRCRDINRMLNVEDNLAIHLIYLFQFQMQIL
jgi:hypothetical protein